MTQSRSPIKRQLNLALLPEGSHELEKEKHRELVEALAELLLEAHGQEADQEAAEPGGNHER